MAEPRKPIRAPGDKASPAKAPAPKVPPAKAAPATASGPKAPAPKAAPAKTAPVKAPAEEAPLIQVPTEPSAPEPTKIDWGQPPFLIAYGLLGLLLLVGLYKWLFSSSGGPRLTRVRGTVTLQGNPLAGAVVTFHPVSKEGAWAVGSTDRLGHFSLKTAGLGNGVVPAEYRVTITKFSSDEKIMDPDEAKKYTGREGKPPPDPKVTNLVPAKYATAETSGLSATVKSGGSMHLPPFDLK